jgi:hypothetical protein
MDMKQSIKEKRRKQREVRETEICGALKLVSDLVQLSASLNFFHHREGPRSAENFKERPDIRLTLKGTVQSPVDI